MLRETKTLVSERLKILTLLTLKVEDEPGAQKYRWPERKTGIGKETDSPLSLQELTLQKCFY